MDEAKREQFKSVILEAIANKWFIYVQIIILLCTINVKQDKIFKFIKVIGQSAWEAPQRYKKRWKQTAHFNKEIKDNSGGLRNAEESSV